MLSYLIVDHDKGIAQEAAAAAIKRGTPLEGGAFIADKDKSYDGINAVITPREIDNDDIAVGEVFNKVPTRVGEHLRGEDVSCEAHPHKDCRRLKNRRNNMKAG